ncbi:MAG: LemA protein [Patescibacteria group bacterium]|nr:LemA protein [Patescibacteria group bacterium]
MSIIFFVLVILLVLSGFFSLITWKMNIIALIALFVIYIVAMYNSLIVKLNRVKNAWADIDVQLKRRYDLIPNLINTVKGAANFESSTLEKVIEARNSAMTAQTSGDKEAISKTENELSGTLKSLFALSENYPDLKATSNFNNLQNELTDTENKIQSARRFYNNTVTDLNTGIQSFPVNILAKMFNFKESEMFKLEESESAAKNPVEVKF